MAGGGFQFARSSSFLGIAECLLHFHGEELNIRKAVPAIKSVAKKIHIHFAARWQPDLTLAFGKRHGMILDVLVLQAKANLWYCLHQIALQTRYLVRIGENPSSPA